MNAQFKAGVDLLLTMQIGERYTRRELELEASKETVRRVIAADAVVQCGTKRCAITKRSAAAYSLALTDGA